jgi:hypothetical protein
MRVTSLQSGGTNLYQTSGGSPFAKAQQDFQDLGKALQSGNLSEAQKAFARLQEDAPSQGGQNPLSSKIDSLGKALDSGDLKGAQEAYSQIEETIAQGPPARGQRGGSGGMPSGRTHGSSSSSGGSQSSKVYDKKDTNRDGTVSAQEELDYALTHPGEATQSQNNLQASDGAANGRVGGTIDFEA